MDILHLNREDISKMGIIEYYEALNYCLLTWHSRNLGVRKSDGKEQGTKTFGIDFSQINSVDQTWVKTESEKRKLLKELEKRSVIPKREVK